MLSLSYSAWKDFDCPYRAYRLRIAKDFKEAENDYMRIGKAVHACIADYMEWIRDRDMPSDLSFFDLVQFKDKSIRDKCLELIEAFKRTPCVALPIGVVDLRAEAQLAFDDRLKFMPGADSWFAKNVGFRAVLDLAYRLEDTIYITDFKTGQGETDRLQIDLYAWAAWNALLPRDCGNRPVNRIVCVVEELAKGSRVTQEYLPGDIGPIGEQIAARLERINSMTEYPAVICAQCRYCQIPDCGPKQEVKTALVTAEQSPTIRIPQEIQTDEEARKALAFLVFADQVTGQLKDLLRQWVEQHGPVEGCGKVAELRENKPWKVKDLSKLTRALVAFGVKPELIWSNLSLSESNLEKLCKKSKIADRLPALLSMGERKDYAPRFGLYSDRIL